MIEEIKKKICELFIKESNEKKVWEDKKMIDDADYHFTCGSVSALKKVNAILDKHNNQPDYKSAFEELTKPIEDIINKAKNEDEIILLGMSGILEFGKQVLEIKKKYNIGGE